MKKIFLIASLALVILSSNLFAREPIFNITKHGGKRVTVGDRTYVGYDRVSQSGGSSNNVYTIVCTKGGINECVAIVGGYLYRFTISDINNPDKKNDFDAAMITNITNQLLEVVEQLNIAGDLSGNLSRNYSLTDLGGIQHIVNFSIDYQLKNTGNGELNVFINTFNQ